MIRNSGVFSPRATQVVEQRPPGGLALAAHVLHGEQHLLAVAPHAEDDEERDRRRLLVEPDAHDGAVEDQPDDVFLVEGALRPGFPIRLHLPPDAADRVLADCPLEQRHERPAHPPGIGAGEIGPGDQRLHLPGHPGVSGQHLALPLAPRPDGTTDPRPRHRDLDRPERAAEPALAVTVPVTRRRRRCRRLPRWHRCGRFCRSRSRLAWSPFVAPPTQRGGQLLLDQPLDKAADLLPNASLDRVEPSLPEKQRRVALHGHAIRRHGVISAGAATPVLAG